MLLQLFLQLRDQIVALCLDLILTGEQFAPQFAALAVEFTLMLLVSEFFFKRRRSHCSSADFLDLDINDLDFLFEAQLQVVGPGIELIDLLLEKAEIALIDFAQQTLLAVFRVGD